jgi:hypothetical protein
MPRVLHILTRPNDVLARDMIARQKKGDRIKVEMVDLTPPAPDYKELLEKIFSAESVECW